MKGFILGVIVTLAVLNPTVTKAVLSNVVDLTHTVVSDAITRAEPKSADQNP